MSAKIRIEMGGLPPRQYEVGSSISIGRSSSCGIVIKDKKASRNHALIRQHGSGIHYLLDSGSSNGTFVNGRRVVLPVALKNGDVINVGSSVLEYLVDGPRSTDSIALDARTIASLQPRKVIVLVVDIHDYTTISEKVPLEVQPMLIGGWFKEVASVIEQYRGVIDRFVGDSVVAYWIKSVASDDVDYVTRPLNVSLALANLAEMYSEYTHDHLSSMDFKIGVGLYMGEAMVGNVEIEGRRDFAAVGNCVDVATGLESATKTTGKTILVGPEIVSLTADSFEFENVGLLELEGNSEKIEAYSLIRALS